MRRLCIERRIQYYLDRYLRQPVEILIGAGNNFQKDLMSAGVSIATHIMRPFATELALIWNCTRGGV